MSAVDHFVSSFNIISILMVFKEMFYSSGKPVMNCIKSFYGNDFPFM